MKKLPYLTDDERQPCEVWTRVMGYHRPVSQFNAGKKSEHAERRYFREPSLPSSLEPTPDEEKRNGQF